MRTTMPEDMPQHQQDQFLQGVNAAHDDPCVFSPHASYWWQRGFATGLIDRIERKFGYPQQARVLQ